METVARNVAPVLSAEITAGYRPDEPVLHNFQLDIRPGEAVGLVGESGSGKSTLARAILRLEHLAGGWSQGRLTFEGRDLMDCAEKSLRSIRGRRIGLVLQSPMTALNPSLRLSTHIREAWTAHRRGSAEQEFLDAQGAALGDVQLPGDRAFLRRYPSQISVGQAQRVLIAMAVLHRPALLIADEATSSLDAITRAKVLDLFRALRRRHHMSLLFITHDLPSALELTDRIVVLHRGQAVESGSPQALLANPVHAYTRELIAAQPAWLRERSNRGASETERHEQPVHAVADRD